MQIQFFRLVHITLAVFLMLHANLGAMTTSTLQITPEEKTKIETFIKENSKFDERNKKEVLEQKKSSMKPAYWVAGGVAVVLATILITAAYDQNEGKFAARNILKILRYFSKAQSNVLALEMPSQPNGNQNSPSQSGNGEVMPSAQNQESQEPVGWTDGTFGN